MNTKKDNSKEKTLAAIAGAFIVFTLVIVGVRLFAKPLSARDVALRAEECFYREDSGCLLSLTDPLEREQLQLTKTHLDEILRMRKLAMPGRWHRSGVPEWDQASNALTLAQRYRNDNGQNALVSFSVGLTGEGYRMVGAVSTLLMGPIISVREQGGPARITTVEKVKRQLLAAQAGEEHLQALGLRGIYSPQQSAEPVRTWSIMRKHCEEIISRMSSNSGS